VVVVELGDMYEATGLEPVVPDKVQAVAAHMQNAVLSMAGVVEPPSWVAGAGAVRVQVIQTQQLVAPVAWAVVAVAVVLTKPTTTT